MMALLPSKIMLLPGKMSNVAPTSIVSLELLLIRSIDGSDGLPPILKWVPLLILTNAFLLAVVLIPPILKFPDSVILISAQTL